VNRKLGLTGVSLLFVLGALAACGGGGGGGGSAAAPAPTNMSRFAYVANFDNNNVSSYSINATTGALTTIGAAVATGSLPVSVTTTGTIL
jgi:6-phosphogluconolactonase